MNKMNIFIGFLVLINGLLGVFHPSFFYVSEKLTPHQIQRNERIWRRGGAVLIIFGIAILAIEFFWK